MTPHGWGLQCPAACWQISTLSSFPPKGLGSPTFPLRHALRHGRGKYHMSSFMKNFRPTWLVGCLGDVRGWHFWHLHSYVARIKPWNKDFCWKNSQYFRCFFWVGSHDLFLLVLGYWFCLNQTSRLKWSIKCLETPQDCNVSCANYSQQKKQAGGFITFPMCSTCSTITIGAVL